MRRYASTRRQFLAASAGAGALAVLGSARPVPAAGAGGTLTLRSSGDIDTLDPAYTTGGSPNYDTLFSVNPSLVHFDVKDGQATWRPTAHVERVAQVDPLHIDFTLKSGLRWSNGFGELTAEDVAYSFDRQKTGEYKGFFEAFERVEIQDSHSGRIVLRQPFAPFMTATLASGAGVIISQKATESVGGKFTTEIPATCGPYLYEWQQKKHIRFTRNPEWAGAKPQFDEINYVFVKENEAAALAYEAGEVACTKITSNTYARYLKQPPAGSKLKVAGALQYMWLGMNTEHPKLKDLRVRRAIQHAVDVDGIVQGAYSGTVEPAYGVVCPGLVGKRSATRHYSYDPDKARALLQDAGVSGLELELRVQNNKERVLSAQVIQANLAAVGLTAKVIPMDSGPFWELGQESKGDQWQDAQIWIMRFSSGPDPYDPFQWFKRDQIGVWNWERWSDDEYEDLYQKGLLETDPAKRYGIYLRMQEIMEATGAYVWLVHEPEVFVHRDTLQTAFTPTGEPQFVYFKKA